jgi:hypothetical protein
MPWHVKKINPLLFLREYPEYGGVGVYRQTDNQLVLTMTKDGGIRAHHLGLWDPEFAHAVGEALMLLARIHQKWMCVAQERKPGDSPEPIISPTQKSKTLERSPHLKAFFDIVDCVAVEVALGRVRADIWESLRSRYDDCIRWANEFERLHAETTWEPGSDENDYFDTIESFASARLAALSEPQPTCASRTRGSL